MLESVASRLGIRQPWYGQSKKRTQKKKGIEFLIEDCV